MVDRNMVDEEHDECEMLVVKKVENNECDMLVVDELENAMMSGRARCD